MSKSFPDLDLTSFPENIDIQVKMIDPGSDTELELIAQYNQFVADNNMQQALDLLTNNPRLMQMCFNAEKFNRHEDQIMALQRFYMSNVEQYLVNMAKYKGTYDGSKKYEKYNIVIFQVNTATQAYIAIADDIPLGTLPTNTDYFVQLTSRGEKGDTGTGLAWRGRFNMEDQYYFGDCVTYNNKLWVSVFPDSFYGIAPYIAPAGDLAYWEVALELVSAEINCGYFKEDVNVHANDANGHRAMNVDGNASGVNVSEDLDSHQKNTFAHPNLMVDGNVQ